MKERIVTYRGPHLSHIDRVREIVEPLLWLVPTWCQLLTIEAADIEGESPGTTANCEADYTYRWASVTIRPLWHTEPPEQQRRIIVHEFLHIALAPLVDAATELAGEDDSKHARIVRGMEPAIEDLSYALMRRGVLE